MTEALINGLISTYRGAIQGVYYGAKVRLPHAFVMTMLFQDGTLREKVRRIAWLSFQHARNLAAFVGIYKGTLTALRILDVSPTPKERGTFGQAAKPIHALIAGGLGGYMVWANYSSVNFQIVLYLVSRVLVALVKLGAARGVWGPTLSNKSFEETYPWLASATWALVLWLYEFHGQLLHPSLEASMRTLYSDSNRWAGLTDFVPSPAAAAVGAYMVASLYWVDKKPLAGLLDLSRTRI